MIIELNATDYDAILKGIAPGDLRLPDSAIAPADVLEMLAGLAATIRAEFSPSAWMMVEDGEIVGICSVVRVPQDGDVHIGYGVAPTRQGHGHASRAIGQVVAWGRNDSRVALISAETGVGNIASQRVLERNGFNRVGERIDAEDGSLICWQAVTV